MTPPLRRLTWGPRAQQLRDGGGWPDFDAIERAARPGETIRLDVDLATIGKRVVRARRVPIPTDDAEAR
jgi:hypothetical protein